MERWLLKIIFAASAVLLVATGVLESPRTAPDERHHYALVKYVAEHYGEFPLHYERVFTDREGDFNHLVHPPLYYYTLATVYKVLSPTKDFTSVGRHYDRFGRVSSDHVIPILRAVSWLIALTGLFGTYLLMLFLIEDFELSSFYAVLVSLLVSFIPGFIYISASLNNDVMVNALWPFALLYTFRFISRTRSDDFWKAVIMLCALVMSKATIWVFCLAMGVVLVLGVAILLFPKHGWAGVVKTIFVSSDSNPQCGTVAVLAAFGCASVLLVFVHLAGNQVRYGSVQPGYDRVFDIPLESNKFYKAGGRENVVGRATYADVTWEATLRGIKSLAGTMGHTERFYAMYPDKLLYLFLVGIAGILVVNCAYFSNNRVSPGAKGFVIASILVPALMYFFFMYRGYSGYKYSGYFGSQGRYAIGYLPFLLCGLYTMASYRSLNSNIFNYVRHLLNVLFSIGLGVVFFRPLHYIHATREIYVRANLVPFLADKLEHDGFRKLSVVKTVPEELATSGYVSVSRDRLNDFYLMQWEKSTLVAALGDIKKDSSIEVRIWALGNDVYFADEPKLIVSLCNDNGEQLHETPWALVELESNIEIYPVSLFLEEPGRDLNVCVKLTNRNPQKFLYLNSFWPQHRTPQIFGIYAKY